MAAFSPEKKEKLPNDYGDDAWALRINKHNGGDCLGIQANKVKKSILSTIQ